MKWFVGVLCALLLAGCNEGDSPAPPEIQPPPANAEPRTDLLVGYYGDSFLQAKETADHVNLQWVWAWEGGDTDTFRLMEARANGIPNTIMGMWNSFDPDAEATTRAKLDHWRSEDLLPYIYGFTPVDEPDVHGVPGEQLRAWASMMRRVMVDYPELGGKNLAIIYGVQGRPAIEEFDLVGWDDYPSGYGVLGAPLAELEAQLRPDQGVILIPGGADGVGALDPMPFYNRAMVDTRIKAIVSFIYVDNWDLQGTRGIHSNGMLPAYCEMGQRIKNPKREPTCDHG